MSIEHSPGFRSAQAAYENATSFDSDCTCLDDDMFICRECGHCDTPKEGDCPDCDGVIEKLSEDARREDFPAVGCPQHDSSYTYEDAADDAREHDYESRMGY